METICTHCQVRLSHTAVGDYCLACGTVYHYNQLPDPKAAQVHITHSFAPRAAASLIDSILPPAAPRPQPLDLLVPQVDPSAVAEPMPQGAPIDASTTRRRRIARSSRPTEISIRRRWPRVIIWFGAAAVIGTLVVMSFVADRPAAPLPAQSAAANQLKATVAQANVQTAPSTDALARDELRKQQLNEIATALSVFQHQTGHYPAGSSIAVLTALQYSNPPYLDKINTDPSSDPTHGRVNNYGYSSDGQHYTLTAKLENTADPQADNGVYQIKN